MRVSSACGGCYEHLFNKNMEPSSKWVELPLILLKLTFFNFAYPQRLHLDKDARLSFTAWYHTDPKVEHGRSLFKISSLGVEMSPQHGSILLINTKRLVHGTAPKSRHVH
jgi:hypothetical protein